MSKVTITQRPGHRLGTFFIIGNDYVAARRMVLAWLKKHPECDEARLSNDSVSYVRAPDGIYRIESGPAGQRWSERRVSA